jgi:uncharacterized protein
MNKRALITGASAGIGEAFARELAADGWDLILVARRQDRLESLAAELRGAVNIEVLAADLTDNSGLHAVEERVRDNEALTLVVNNAGFGAYRSFVDIEPDIADELIDIHVRAVVRIARAALPGMVARGSGGILNVASLLAFSGTLPADPLPRRAIYAAAKSFMVTFTQVLAGELAGSGVKVSVCCPGVVATEFHDVQGMDMSHLPRMTARDLARGALKGWERGEVVCVPALGDPALIEAVGDAQRSLLMSARTPDLASRYR